MRFYAIGNGQLHQMSMKDVANTLDTMHDAQIVMKTVINSSGGGISATLDASYYKGTGSRNGKEREVLAVGNEQSERKYVVRRLTPVECLRLQGLPDWWCDGANGSDSAIYKMAGNGLAIPCAFDALRRIAEYAEKEDADHGSDCQPARLDG